MEIADNERVAFVGEDESGKTSLLRIFSKLEKLTKGEVFIKDIPLEKLDYKTDLSAGYVPASPVFIEKKTVYENFKYILKGWGYSDNEIESKINNAIITYSLEKIKDTKMKDLSLEEKYVLSLIRLSFRELDLLMVDNIFDKLSETTFEVVMRLIKELTSKKTTLIVATTKENIADMLCKRKLYFKYGSIVKSLDD
ncbi:MAG: ATP-binding cassette domain-containing protein [Clostridia bacterium]|jgi:ABC-type multidrug transport system ATPase subunit|nr:ATP-binding cassette domain-containing protein [Clostridia bacterium]